MKSKELFNKLVELESIIGVDHNWEFDQWSLDVNENEIDGTREYIISSSIPPNGHMIIVSQQFDEDTQRNEYIYHGNLYEEQNFDNLDINTCIALIDSEINKAK